MKSILIAVFLLLAVNSWSQPEDETYIRNMLAKHTEAWNRGDLEGFMKGYWESDSLTFIGQSGITYGWNKTLDNYRRVYPDTGAMMRLQFTLMSLKQLSPEYFSDIGRW